MAGFSLILISGFITFAFLTFMAIFAGIIIYSVISYIFDGIAVSQMCRNLGFKACFTTWIPFYGKYSAGKAAGMNTAGAISGILGIISVLSCAYCYYLKDINYAAFAVLLISLLIGCICDIAISHRLFKKAVGNYADLMTVLNSLTFGLFRPIMLFFIRNKVTATVTEYETAEKIQ